MIVGLSSITINNVNVPLGTEFTLFCTGYFPPSSVSHAGRRVSCAQAVPVTLSLASGLDGGLLQLLSILAGVSPEAAC